MSYRRSPRCSNCYRTGHTKVACPDLSSYMKERYKEIAKNRACKHCSRNGYDNAVGHNKRGCKLYREDREAYKKDVLRFRQMMVDIYNNHKIGVGTIISCKIGTWRRYGKYADIDTDILVVESMDIPVNITAPLFKCKSTLTGEYEYYRVTRPGMTNFDFVSCLERFGSKTIHIGYREREIDVLSDSIPGSQMIVDIQKLFDENTIRYPDKME